MFSNLLDNVTQNFSGCFLDVYEQAIGASYRVEMGLILTLTLKIKNIVCKKEINDFGFLDLVYKCFAPSWLGKKKKINKNK